MDGRTDGELLGAWVAGRDEAAFREVVRRHEALVVNACARVLGDAQDARDAAQAVFLALSLKAGRLDLARPVGPWLHHVACGVAVNALKEREARRRRERNAVVSMRDDDGLAEELRPLLDRELDRLPERYRRPLVLFHLEGRSLEETAELLGSPAGTVGAWLSRGRNLLRERLLRLGVPALSVAALSAVLSREASAHAAGPAFAGEVARAAAGGPVSGAVSLMTEGVMKMMFLAKVKSAALTASLAATILGANLLLFSGAPAAPSTASAAEFAAAEEPFAGLPVETLEPGGPPQSSDLVGHWKLDDDKIADSSGKGRAGKAVGAVAFVEGKGGNAASFDGKDEHVELPNSEELDKLQEGSFTISAWFKPKDVPPGTESANNAHYGIVIKAGWHLGLTYSNEQKFVMTHWLAGEKPEEPEWKGAGTWEDSYAPGSWYHAVGTVDRPNGKVAIYVNGELKSEAEYVVNAKARDYAQTPWRIGVAYAPAEQWGWSAKGQVDDVRLYNRCLSAGDVKSLFDAAAK